MTKKELLKMYRNEPIIEVEIVVEDVEGYFDEHINLSPRDFEDVLRRIKNSVSAVVFDSIYDVIEEAIEEAMFTTN
jgi:hypothetical protein